MSKKIIREDYLDGIKVKVVSKPRGFDVSITIEEGTYLWQKRESENCCIKITSDYSDRYTGRDMKFTAKKQQYYRTQLLKHFRKSFTFSEGGVLNITLFPTFFLPEDLAEKSRIERQLRDQYGGAKPGICTRAGGSKGQKHGSSTQYKHRNACKLYKGWSCTPK